MGAFKNHEFLGLLEKEQERERMELARREQEYLTSRKANQQQPAKSTTTNTARKGK